MQRWLTFIFLFILLAGCTAAEPPVPPVTSPPLVFAPPPTPPITPPTGGVAAEAPVTVSAPAGATRPALTATDTATAVAPPTPFATPRWRIGAAPGVPAVLQAAAQSLPAPFGWSDPEAADLVLRVNGGTPLATWVYVAAGPFTTIADGIEGTELRRRWNSGELLLTDDAGAAWRMAWGEPAGGPSNVAPADLVPTLWQQGEPALALLPMEALTPDLKVLAIDGQSPLSPGFVTDDYLLTLAIGVEGAPEAVAALQAAWSAPTTNWDPARLTRVAMTGVTALTRATAYQMEIFGVDYPGEEVGPVLRSADIAHVSNEVAFAPDCPYPNPLGGTTFCARDAYLQLLVDAGIDVVELTGNHVNDWGAENLAHSIDLYEQAGMAIFGGGRDLAAAAEPALFDHHGNRIAFVGCNPVGPAYAWATAARPGSNPCSGTDLETEIAALREQGYLVIATLQYQEAYHYGATPQQRADFRRLAAAGAAAVNGSQGHHAQGFDFHAGAFIHYGTGNLFFDQMQMLGTRQTFVDTYVVYEGRLVTVELWTGLIENYARPRLMTGAERAALLQQVFAVSEWSP